MPHFSKVAIEALNFKSISRSKKGSNVVYISESLNADVNPRIQLNTQLEPKLVCPFGLNSFDNVEGGRMTLDISLETTNLVEFGERLDAHILKVACERKKEWFKEGTSDEQIKMMYYPLVSFDTTGKGYAPKLHCKVNMLDGDKQLKVLRMLPGNKYTTAHPDELRKKFVRVMAITELTNVWFQKLQFGVTMIVTDAIIFPQDERPEFAFSWEGETPSKKEEMSEKAALVTDEESQERDAQQEIDSFGSASILMEVSNSGDVENHKRRRTEVVN